MIKTRIFKQENYKGIHINGKTIRIALNPKKPIDELTWPEFYDVKMEEFCLGRCPYCYVDSKHTDPHMSDIISKFKKFFESMTDNQKPFQIAFGGGEPTEHPDFIELMKLSHSMGITPNYTTNGMWVKKPLCKQKAILDVTKDFCGGVALSTHTHLKRYWTEAANKFIKQNIFTNFHIIIGDKSSIDNFLELYNKYSERGIKYFVLLPLMETGRAKNVKVDFEYLHKMLPDDMHDIAFGANFYPFLCDYKSTGKYKLSLYEPEIMSGYLDLNDMQIYKSSFSPEHKTKHPYYGKYSARRIIGRGIEEIL